MQFFAIHFRICVCLCVSGICVFVDKAEFSFFSFQLVYCNEWNAECMVQWMCVCVCVIIVWSLINLLCFYFLFGNTWCFGWMYWQVLGFNWIIHFWFVKKNFIHALVMMIDIRLHDVDDDDEIRKQRWWLSSA